MLEETLTSDKSQHNQDKNSNPLILNFDGVKNKNNKEKKELKNQTNNNEITFQDKISERIGSVKNFFKRERLGFIYCLLAQFLWTSNSVYVKFITQYYNERFKNKTFLFPRGLVIIIISYFLGNNFDGKIYKLSEFTPQIKKCLLIRAIVSFFRMSLWLIAVYYLRITTCQIISTLSPIIQIYFSVIFLNEKYYSRYTIGVIV